MLTLLYVAPNDHTGYGCAAEQFIRLFREMPVAVRVLPLRSGPALGLWYEPDEAPGFAQWVREATGTQTIILLHTVPEYYAPLRAWLEARGMQGIVLGVTVWETSRLPRHWPRLLNAADGLIVPSTWNRDVFLQSGVQIPVYVVPHASEFLGRHPGQMAQDALVQRLPDLRGRFLFYSIGAWSTRKGTSLLVSTFLQAFQDRDDVVLVLKTTPHSLDPKLRGWRRLLRRYADKDWHAAARRSPRIVLLTDDLSSAEIAALHALGGCYVTCTRGEGWGIGLFEALLFGNPVIAPDKGGHRAYLPWDEYPGLFTSSWTPVRTPGYDASYTPDQEWVEPDQSALTERMLAILDVDQQQISTRAREYGALASKRFSPENITVALRKVLRAAQKHQKRT